MSFRECKCELYLVALKRAIPLFFAFDRRNSFCWTPLCYDRLLLKEVFPDLYTEFMDGDFKVKFSQGKCRSISL